MNETELRDRIIKDLSEKRKILEKNNYTLTEPYIRGYITGTEQTGVIIPCHWYNDMIKKILN